MMYYSIIESCREYNTAAIINTTDAAAVGSVSNRTMAMLIHQRLILIKEVSRESKERSAPSRINDSGHRTPIA